MFRTERIFEAGTSALPSRASAIYPAIQVPEVITPYAVPKGIQKELVVFPLQEAVAETLRPKQTIGAALEAVKFNFVEGVTGLMSKLGGNKLGRRLTVGALAIGNLAIVAPALAGNKESARDAKIEHVSENFGAEASASVSPIFNSLQNLILGRILAKSPESKPTKKSKVSTTLDRATQDRPDEKSGEQVHVVYVLPADGRDRQFDNDGLRDPFTGKISNSIQISTGAMQRWFYSKTNQNEVIRFDTFNKGDNLDTTFVRCSRPNSEIIGGSHITAVKNIETCLRQAGLNDENKKYYIFYDGDANFCSYQSSYGNVLFLNPNNSTYTVKCRTTAIGQSPPYFAGYLELGGARGNLSVMEVQFVSDSAKDLMYFVGNKEGINNAPPSEVELDTDGKSYTTQIRNLVFMEGPVNINVVGQGTADVGPDKDNCKASCTAWEQMGANIGVKATPDSGWQLKSVTGAGSAPEYYFKMDSKKSIQVTFAESTITPKTATLVASIIKGKKKIGSKIQNFDGSGKIYFKGKEFRGYTTSKIGQVIMLEFKPANGSFVSYANGCLPKPNWATTRKCAVSVTKFDNPKTPKKEVQTLTVGFKKKAPEK